MYKQIHYAMCIKYANIYVSISLRIWLVSKCAI